MAKIKKIKLPNENNSRDLVDAGAVRYDEATSLTANQKTQARSNIDVSPKSTVDNLQNTINAAVPVELVTLDATITGMSASKTLASLTQTDGVISATFQDIAINQSQVNQSSGDILVLYGGTSTSVV